MSRTWPALAGLIFVVGCKSQPANSEKVAAPTPKQATSAPAAPAKTTPSETAANAPAATSMHAAFDAILKATVRDQRVDYTAVKTTHLGALDAYLDVIAKTDVEPLDDKQKLALYINLYNATMIKTALDRYTPTWSPADGDYQVFKDKVVRLKSGAVSLNDLENEIIRKQFKEPRIHVALVCGARSCPPLIPRAYEAADLDAVLEANMKAFVTSGQRNKIDATKKTLTLSKIFKWYAADFGGDAGVAKYINRYTNEDTSSFKISFSDYSWQLNSVAP